MFNSNFIQEAVAFNFGNNFIPVNNRFRYPNEKEDVSVFLLSDSFKSDIQLIKNNPSVQIEYNHILIPFRVIDKIGMKPFRFITSVSDYTKKISHINDLKLQPRLISVRYPYPSTIDSNLYIPMSEIMTYTTSILRGLSVKYIRENIFDIFNQIFDKFSFSSNKIIVIDTKLFKIYQYPVIDNFKSDLINALLTGLLFNPENKIKKLDYTIIFRAEKTDVKFELNKYNVRSDGTKLRKLLKLIGMPSDMPSSSIEESIDEIEDGKDDDVERIGIDINTEDDEDIKHLQSQVSDDKKIDMSITSSINNIKEKLADVTSPEKVIDVVDNKDSNYNAKTLSINTSLLRKINPMINNVNTNNQNNTTNMASALTSTTDGKDTKDIIDNTVKDLSDVSTPVDDKDAETVITSARELALRHNLGRLRINSGNKINTAKSMMDVKLPTASTPTDITTTNTGSMKGTAFPNFAKVYEDKMMDKDIVSIFMNLANLPNGFIIKDINITDISTIMNMMNNWCVTLMPANSNVPMKINVRVPRVLNGRFLYNGMWYNIKKQDFPIPILKIGQKKVILTTNYNKITVIRYDTRSLVDISMLMKVINKYAVDQNGDNKYVKTGSSIQTNSRFVSTIEFDEYAKKWVSFVNKEAKCELYFNRTDCAQRYSFVSVQANEFCCGMINKVPIVINTDTSLTRQGLTLTDVMLSSLPEDLYKKYKSLKPGKLSMYAEIIVGNKMPLGVACCAWEGLTSVLKKSGCKYEFTNTNASSDNKHIVIPFKDKSLSIENTIVNQLIFNGFYRINTKAYNINEFDDTINSANSIYIDIFNQIFFKRYSQLTTFMSYYNFFVDPITREVCNHYNIPDDIVGMLLYASKLLSDNSFASESNASLYRLRSSEIIPAIIHYSLATAISRYTNTIGSKNRANKIQFNPNEVINVLTSQKTVNPISSLNPMIELNDREIVTKIGFRGVNNDRTFTQEKRAYDNTYIGKMALSSPNNGNVGINRQLVAAPRVDSVRGYTTPSSGDDKLNDLQLSSFSELLTPGTVSRDDAIRTAIATSQTGHILPTTNAEPVIVSNGIDEIVPAYLSSEFSVIADEDGIVLDDSDGYMIVEYKSKKKRAINIGNRYGFNTGSGFYVNNKLKSNFQPGDTFKKDDILAYHEKFFTKDSQGVVRMNVGPLTKVAFAGLYSTYEDAGLLTTKMSKKLQTSISMEQMIKLNASDDIESIVKVGDTVEVGDPLVIFGLGGTGDKAVDNFLRAFSNGEDNSLEDNSKRKIKAKNAGTIVDVKIYTMKSMDKLSPSLFKIVDEHFKQNLKRRKILDKYDKSSNVFKMDTLFDLPTEPLKGSSIKGINTDVLVEIKIEHSDDASVGDKLVAYGAAKQIISEVVPEGMEPYTENRPNEEVSMFISSSSILKRMIPSLLITSCANKVMIVLKEKIGNIWNGKE